jgi:hypothetical protein
MRFDQHIMRYWKFSVIIIAFIPQVGRAQSESRIEYLPPSIKDSLVKELSIVAVDDQKYRNQIDYIQAEYGGDSPQMKTLEKNMKETDSVNLKKVESIVSKYGWLGPDVIGKDGNKALFMVIQHADLDAQDKYLPVIRDAVKKGDAKAYHLALLEDRVALLHGNKQIYGSQVSWNMRSNQYYLAPLVDPDNVDKRRMEVGLAPLADYLLEIGIVWDLEQYKKDLPEIESIFFKKK